MLVLSTGNVVVTAVNDDFGGNNAGAVYLFNGTTGALISALRGSTAGDNVGNGGVTALANGNFLIRSPNWDNGAAAEAGAVTWASGLTGVSGTVSAVKSLVGSVASDQVGSNGVVALSNGNYVVRSQNWDNGAATNAGAVTWGNGFTGSSGAISAANSLVGTTANDQIGGTGVTALPNGNFVVTSANWDNGAVSNAGAATWVNGSTGISGSVSSSNSLVGTTANDHIGGAGVTVLPNGNFVVRSTNWDNGAVVDAGAATWGNGTSGISGAVSATNSLVGTTANDQIGNAGLTVVSNGNYLTWASSTALRG